MIVAKKSLGQNFLTNGAIINEIVKVTQVAEEDTVLEIGPGEGVLTAQLLATGATVVAVEKDDRLIELLNKKFSDYSSKGLFTLVHEDILEFEAKSYNLKAGSYKIVANIPYYITGLILRQFLESDYQPASMVLMVQKEVAERICARDGKESILSMSVKAYGEPVYIRTVPKTDFEPAPNVDSAVLLINNISKSFFSDLSENRFFEVVKKGFGQKRKMLKGNLDLSEEIMEKCGIPVKARAENLNLTQWKCLARVKVK